MRLLTALWAAGWLAYAPVVAAQDQAPSPDVREWKISANGGPQSVAIGPDGRVFVAATFANKVLAFDPASATVASWDLGSGTLPRTLAVDRAGQVYFAALGGALGRLDPASGRVDRYAFAAPSSPYWVEISPSGRVWFSDPGRKRIGSLDPATGASESFLVDAEPQAIAVDTSERVWAVLRGDDALAVLNPRTRLFKRIKLVRGARPRALAAAPDGAVWVVLAGSAALLRIDGPRLRDVTEYQAPLDAGAPSSLAIGGDGTVWVSFERGARIWRIDPATRAPEIVDAVAPARSPRPAAVDGEGRLWFVSAERGVLGRVR
jgi:virginiamycin B lyase